MKLNPSIVRRLREARHWSQEQLAAAAGLIASGVTATIAGKSAASSTSGRMCSRPASTTR